MTKKEQRQYDEAFIAFQRDFLKLVSRYQNVYNLPINISLSLDYTERWRVPATDVNPLGIVEGDKLWCTKNTTMVKTVKPV